MKHARRIVGFAVLLIASIFASATAATGAKTSAWSEPKAEKVVVRDVRLRLEPATRASMEEELQREIANFRGLQRLALEEGDEDAWWLYHAWGNRYLHPLLAVRRGLSIDDADCSGEGLIVGGARFRQFSCLVMSETLQIPSNELQLADGEELPAVIEGESREVGPFLSQLRVRVTGSSTFKYR